MRLEAKWKNDCQGKQDYDAELVSLSSRYYPRGGGFHEYDPATGEWIGNESRQEIEPGAICSIYIQEEEILTKQFKGETEGEVKLKVELWAQDQFNRITKLLKTGLNENETQ